MLYRSSKRFISLKSSAFALSSETTIESIVLVTLSNLIVFFLIDEKIDPIIGILDRGDSFFDNFSTFYENFQNLVKF